MRFAVLILFACCALTARTLAEDKTTATPTTPTTIPKTTPAPQPTPAANLTVGNYNLTVNNKICLMAQMELQIRLETPKANGTFIVQPSQTKPSGEYLETKASLTLSFSQGFITFNFLKIDTENTAYAESVSLSLTYPFSTTGPSHYVAKNSSLNLFAARLGYCYSSKKETLYMGQGLYLDFSQQRMQAFNISNGEFGDPDFCQADRPGPAIIALAIIGLLLAGIMRFFCLRACGVRRWGYRSF